MKFFIKRIMTIVAFGALVIGGSYLISGKEASAQVENDPWTTVVTCIDFDNQKQVYRGPRGAFVIESSHISVFTKTHHYVYPSHMCILAAPR